MEDIKQEKIAKVIARSGVCSRREAEVLIVNGHVKVNGTTNINPATRVSEDDQILVDDKIINKKSPTRLFLFYKPKGCITSTKDPKGRKLVFDYIPKSYPRLISVGRLDYNSEGLLLLTNDGGLARRLELPQYAEERSYRVRAFGVIDKNMITKIAEGITIDGISYKPATLIVERQSGDNVWSRMIIREGKNREIRKVFEYFGLQVNRLIRTSYGKYQLGTMRECEIKEVYDQHNFRDI